MKETDEYVSALQQLNSRMENMEKLMNMLLLNDLMDDVERLTEKDRDTKKENTKKEIPRKEIPQKESQKKGGAFAAVAGAMGNALNTLDPVAGAVGNEAVTMDRRNQNGSISSVFKGVNAGINAMVNAAGIAAFTIEPDLMALLNHHNLSIGEREKICGIDVIYIVVPKHMGIAIGDAIYLNKKFKERHPEIEPVFQYETINGMHKKRLMQEKISFCVNGKEIRIYGE